MLDVLKNTALVLFGVFLGVIGSFMLHDLREAEIAAIAEADNQKKVTVTSPGIRSSDHEVGISLMTSDGRIVSASPDPSPNPVEDVRLPMAYREQIGDVRPRRPSFSERHDKFADEKRNESWAFAMESGIENYFAAHAPAAGIVIESVECRSESCEVAGYLIDETDGLSDEIFGFTSDSWWQGGNSVSVHEMDVNNYTGFVFVTFDHDMNDLRYLQNFATASLWPTRAG